MIRRAFMVVCVKGEAVFVYDQYSRAVDYATKQHGYIVNLIGSDDSPPRPDVLIVDMRPPSIDG